MHAPFEATVLMRAHLKVVANGPPSSLLARRMRGGLPLRYAIPVQRHAERCVHLLRRALRDNAPPPGVLFNDAQPPVFQILRNPVDLFFRGPVPLEELFLRQVDSLVRRSILPMLKTRNLRAARPRSRNHGNRDPFVRFYTSKQRRSLNLASFTAR